MTDYTFKLDGLRTKHSKPEIVASLRRYAEQYGVDTVSTREYDEWSDRVVSTRTLCAVFGSWGKALQAAGLRSQRTAKLQFRDMVEAFKGCWLEVDHIIPDSKKGRPVMENLQTLCFTCNRGKSNIDD